MKPATPIGALVLLAAVCLLFEGCKPAEEIKRLAKKNPPAEAPASPAPAESDQNDENTGPPPSGETEQAEAAPELEPEPINTNAKAAILGYHRFSETPEIRTSLLPTTIYIEKFRAQLQTLVDNDIPVISLGDFLAWRRGEKNIPPFSIIITIDDGWKSTYTVAFPVLKEFGFPFTLYLYTNFLNGGGKMLSFEQIAEMVAGGAEIGSHSVTHSDLRNRGRRSDEIQAAYLKEETAGSRRILREKLGIDPKTFSYPYGFYNEEVMQACVEAGYEAMVTVSGQKVGWETDLREVGRYIVHGKDDRAFDWAVSTRLPVGVAAANNILKETQVDEATGEEKPLAQVEPPDDSTIKDRRPLIEADLSQLEGIDPESLQMSVSGLGEVRAVYDEEKKVLSYRPVQRLRLPDYWVQVEFKREGEKKSDIMRWKFAIDAIANYKELVPEASESGTETPASPPPDAPATPPDAPATPPDAPAAPSST